MNWFPQRVASESSQEQGANSEPTKNRDKVDSAILDAYSTAVIHVVEAVSPAVISVMGRGQESILGSGSGFIIAPEGYAVTNSHVVAGRRRLLAETNEGDRVDAEVIGNDPLQISRS